MMNEKAFLVNTARGGLVDDGALLDALEARKIAGAGLDCVEDEHSEVTKKLLTKSNVIITPHIGGSTTDLGSVIIPMIAKNILALDAGDSVSFLVNHPAGTQ